MWEKRRDCRPAQDGRVGLGKLIDAPTGRQRGVGVEQAQVDVLRDRLAQSASSTSAGLPRIERGAGGRLRAAATGTLRTTHFTSGSDGRRHAEDAVAQAHEQHGAQRLGRHLAADARREAARSAAAATICASCRTTAG